MKKRILGATSLSGSIVYFLFGLALVTSLSTYQGYSAPITHASFFANSWQWLASILFCWGLLLIFFTSARRTVRAVWSLVVIIAALGVGRFIGSHSVHQIQYQEPSVSMAVVSAQTQQTQEPITLPQPSDLNQSYQQAVMESGWYSILDISRLQNDTDLVESYAIIKDTKTAILNHLLQTQQQVHELEQQLYDNEASAQMEDNYIDAQILHSQQQNEMWKAELAALQEVRSIIEMLDANRDGWTIQDGAIVFHSNADKQRFEDIVARIKVIADHQRELTESVE
ncbi:hypothetical protein BCT61_07100 [Vibrio breoganii]|uniref:hypothetical protein n=1 Tax=Vibrio breoganii TaxID=553239 RepID=UPI000C85CC47|nr:hypothetical protein [Vibrio breoganii]PMG89694.1 hypothetical protein BCU81_07750 [Vibrio breoganii]PML21737.1 hypothetical protein BCT82_02865 [Vibrio breoganii]PML32938.1 hypothetical protein BCT78_15325 [Vibrio breoganii]PMM00347.1 hypothetical protein BCT64_03345 [Vibrio breoganii]PMM11300.1 hypothetical protein BCT61_07100 [Vibrio breoganii]